MLPTVLCFLLFIKNVVFLNREFNLFAKMYEIWKNFRNKFVYFEEFYKVTSNQFFIGIIFFIYKRKMLLKIETFGLQKNYTRYEKNFKKQNCLSQEDIQIYFRLFFYWIRSFRFNCKKRCRKWKTPFCSKSMWDTKIMF